MEKKCRYCGKEFYISPSRSNKRFCCSQSCASKLKYKNGVKLGFQKGHKSFEGTENTRFTADKVKGEKNVNWKGGVSKINKTERQLIMETKQYENWRTNVFLRDKWTCQTCNKRGDKIRAHHIKSWKDYPKERLEINNGVTLCEKCHKNVHRIRGH